MKKLRILLADDHDLVRQGLRVLIEREPKWKVCGEAATGPEAVEETLRLSPDVAVVDFMMPGLDGLEVTRQIRRAVPACEVLLFTGSSESDELFRQAFDSGAKSLILKTDVGEQLTDALKSLAAHKPFFTDQASAVIFARFLEAGKRGVKNEDGGRERLTPGERSLVRLLSAGHSNASVGRKQKKSARTVEIMRAGIMHKLQLASFADLIRYAARNGIIKL